MIYLLTGPVSAAEGGLYVCISLITGPASCQLRKEDEGLRLFPAVSKMVTPSSIAALAYPALFISAIDRLRA
jgi:hypothetical protein